MGPAAETARTSPVIDLSCTDWAQRLRAGQSLVKVAPINPAEGQRAVDIFNMLRLADVPGTPTMAEAGGEWFRGIIRAIFGSLDPITRMRAIRELLLLVPKKNSKTTNGALMMLTALLMNQRPRGTLIMTAPVQDVAELAFDAAAGAIALDPTLEKLLHVRDHLKTIVHRQTKAELQIMTFDPAVVTGQKPIGILIDELHVVAKMSKAPAAIRQLRGGMLPYPEAFLAFITTQSEEAPTGVFHDELQKARDIRDGKRVGVMLPVLYEFPPAVQADPLKWQDPKFWKQVTPNEGRSIQIARLVDEFNTARDTSDAELRAWASQHLNVEIGLALMSDSWVGASYWKKQKPLSLEELIDRSEVVTVGIDGGGLDDMLGLAVMGREKKSGLWLLWNHAWLHPIALERRKKEIQRYRTFEKDGDLTIVKKIGTDVIELVDVVEQLERSGLLDRVGVDQAGIGMIPDELMTRDRLKLKEDRIVGIPQGWKMVSSIKATERKLAEDGIRHGGSRLMAWCVGNAKVEPRGNAIIITKQASGTAKIDPLLATFNAATLMAMNPKPRKRKIHMFTVGNRT
jgi:phage terminase large subunit-like protein